MKQSVKILLGIASLVIILIGSVGSYCSFYGDLEKVIDRYTESGTLKDGDMTLKSMEAIGNDTGAQSAVYDLFKDYSERNKLCYVEKHLSKLVIGSGVAALGIVMFLSRGEINQFRSRYNFR